MLDLVCNVFGIVFGIFVIFYFFAHFIRFMYLYVATNKGKHLVRDLVLWVPCSVALSLLWWVSGLVITWVLENF